MKTKVAIAGVGGVGSWLCQSMYTFGMEREQFPINNYSFDLFDSEKVEPDNLLHQNFTYDDLDKYKAQAISERFPGMFDPICRFMTKEDFTGYDIIMCCVDSMSFRRELYTYGWENPEDMFWIDGRCTSKSGALFTSAEVKAKLQAYIDESDVRGGCLLNFEKKNKVAHATPIIVANLIMQAFLDRTRSTKTRSHSFML